MQKSKWEKIPKESRNAIEALIISSGQSLNVLFEEEDDCTKRGIAMLTKKEASLLAKVSVDTITRRIKDGSLKVKKIHPGRNGAVRIFRDSFESWLKNNQQTKTTK